MGLGGSQHKVIYQLPGGRHMPAIWLPTVPPWDVQVGAGKGRERSPHHLGPEGIRHVGEDLDIYISKLSGCTRVVARDERGVQVGVLDGNESFMVLIRENLIEVGMH